jgi:hypothetical protein
MCQKKVKGFGFAENGHIDVTLVAILSSIYAGCSVESCACTGIVHSGVLYIGFSHAIRAQLGSDLSNNVCRFASAVRASSGSRISSWTSF